MSSYLPCMHVCVCVRVCVMLATINSWELDPLINLGFLARAYSIIPGWNYSIKRNFLIYSLVTHWHNLCKKSKINSFFSFVSHLDVSLDFGKHVLF